MAKIKVIAGDWPKGDGQFIFGQFQLPKPGWTNDVVKANQLESIEVASEDSVKRIGGTVGWGAAGAVLLGPIGLLAGLIAGGRGKDVTFVAKFKDGRKLLGSTDSKTFKKLMALVF